MTKTKEITQTILGLLAIPVLVLIVGAPALITANLSPVSSDESSNDKSVLGLQRYRGKDFEIAISDGNVDAMTYDAITNTYNLNISSDDTFVHFKRDDVITITNQSSDWKEVRIDPQLKQVPNGVEIALTMGSTSYVLVDSGKNIYPAVVTLAPNEVITLGFRMDAEETINYAVNVVLSLKVY
ncbi:hypothetical protein JW962_02475 [Candidatus Dojkabacteria bacterium]|nr:hypothetical protein [Candidatus Dojkabacteria bacterium]